MSSFQDKYVRSKFEGSKENEKFYQHIVFIIIMSFLEQIQAISEPVPSLSAELGTRLRAACNKIGKDISVQLSGKSWKQMLRYFDGAEPGVILVRNVAVAAQVSLDYLIDGRIVAAEDAMLERSIIDERIAMLDALDASKATREEIKALSKATRMLTDRSFELGKMAISKLTPSDVDRDALNDMREYVGLDKIGAEEVPPPLTNRYSMPELIKYVNEYTKDHGGELTDDQKMTLLTTLWDIVSNKGETLDSPMVSNVLYLAMNK